MNKYTSTLTKVLAKKTITKKEDGSFNCGNVSLLEFLKTEIKKINKKLVEEEKDIIKIEDVMDAMIEYCANNISHLANKDLAFLRDAENIVFFEDQTSKDPLVYVINKETKEYEMFAKTKILELIAVNKNKKVLVKSFQNAHYGDISSLPHKTRLIPVGPKKKDGTVEKYCLNLYNSPFDYYSKFDVKSLPDCYKKFFDWIFADKTSQEYFLNWAAYSLKSRNICMCVLITDTEGVGKGVIEKIMNLLHLEENSIRMNVADISDKYSNHKGKTFGCLDEVSQLTTSDQENLKLFANDKIKDEAKYGQKALIENTLNLMFTANSNPLKLKDTDRRYSFLDLIEIPLHAWPYLKELNVTHKYFVENVLLLHENIEKLFNYLAQRDVSKYSHSIPLINEKKKTAILESESKWKKRTREIVTRDNSPHTVKSILAKINENSQFPVSENTVVKYLLELRNLGVSVAKAKSAGQTTTFKYKGDVNADSPDESDMEHETHLDVPERPTSIFDTFRQKKEEGKIEEILARLEKVEEQIKTIFDIGKSFADVLNEDPTYSSAPQRFKGAFNMGKIEGFNT